MPKIGDIKPHNSKNKACTSIWAACIDCGKERWVQYLNKRIVHPRCQSCACKYVGKNLTPEQRRQISKRQRGSNNSCWKGGKVKTDHGYIGIKVDPDDFFYTMANVRGYVPEHRLVVAKHLGRCLQSWEHIHHLNRVKTDNRIANLMLTTVNDHLKIRAKERHTEMERLHNEVKRLKAENKQLRKQLHL